MTPKWQRARIIADPDDPEVVGFLIWTSTEHQPHDHLGRWGWCRQSLLTNVVWEDQNHFVWNKAYLELLARSEDDFAEDVPLIPWEKFLASCRNSKPSQS
jgi:hypothetical protein